MSLPTIISSFCTLINVSLDDIYDDDSDNLCDDDSNNDSDDLSIVLLLCWLLLVLSM